MVLGKMGHQVETAVDGQDALEIINKHPASFDVLITDNGMPRVTGIQLVEKIRGLNLPVKVIMASMFCPPLDAETAERLRLDGLLKKPYTAKDLSDCLENLGK